MLHIKIIIGSVRPNRFGPTAAEWINDLAKKHTDATFEVVDLAEVNLPFLDEPQPPSTEEVYVQEHTKAWAKTIGEADGYIIVTPEYNHGVAPALKNAIDFLDKEWHFKPVAFVSYGADAGGARAIEHLRATAAWLRMYDLYATVMMPMYWTQFDETGAFHATDRQQEDAERLLREITFWSEQMKAARQAKQSA